MRKLAIGRIIGMLLAVTSLGIAVLSGYESWRFNQTVHGWDIARPMETAIDLSRTGAVTVPFDQTCSVSHGEAVYLDCDLRDDTGQVPEELLKGLSGKLVITNAAGEEIVRRSLMNDGGVPSGEPIVYRGRPGGEIMLVNLPTFAAGKYSATITVDQPAPALAGYQQTVYARYQLCGLEQMPVAILGFISFCAGFVALVSGSTTLPGWWRHGIWKPVSPEEPPSEDSAAQKGASSETDSSDSEPPRELFF